jgi:hypothetical protein
VPGARGRWGTPTLPCRMISRRSALLVLLLLVGMALTVRSYLGSRRPLEAEGPALREVPMTRVEPALPAHT